MFSVNQGYYIVYNFLEYYWQSTDKYSDYSNDLDGDSFTLVTIVSTMNPEDMDNPSPMDPAKYQDWLDIMKKLCKTQNECTEKEIFNGMIAYLNFYRNHFHFKIQNVIDDVSKKFEEKYRQEWDSIIQGMVK